VLVGSGGEESIDSSSDVAVGRVIEVDVDSSSVEGAIEVDGDANSDGAKMPVNTISVIAIAIKRILR
jgi:hypothetical protein